MVTKTNRSQGSSLDAKRYVLDPMFISHFRLGIPLPIRGFIFFTLNLRHPVWYHRWHHEPMCLAARPSQAELTSELSGHVLLGWATPPPLLANQIDELIN